MVREKIEIEKTASTTARQVTFSKRRRGLFKKAEELAVLCDAEVALVVFSSTGELFRFCSSSMEQVLEKHSKHSKMLSKLDESLLDLNMLDHSKFGNLNEQIAETSHRLRQMRGEALENLTVEEIQQLERTLEAGLSRVLDQKNKRITEQINSLQQKSLQLMEENARLKQQVLSILPDGEESGISEDESATDDAPLIGGRVAGRWKIPT